MYVRGFLLNIVTYSILIFVFGIPYSYIVLYIEISYSIIWIFIFGFSDALAKRQSIHVGQQLLEHDGGVERIWLTSRHARSWLRGQTLLHCQVST